MHARTGCRWRVGIGAMAGPLATACGARSHGLMVGRGCGWTVGQLFDNDAVRCVCAFTHYNATYNDTYNATYHDAYTRCCYDTYAMITFMLALRHGRCILCGVRYDDNTDVMMSL